MTRKNPPDMATMSDDDERHDVIYHGALSPGRAADLADFEMEMWQRAHVFPEHREPRGIVGPLTVAAGLIVALALGVWYAMAFADALQVGLDVRGWK